MHCMSLKLRIVLKGTVHSDVFFVSKYAACADEDLFIMSIKLYADVNQPGTFVLLIRLIFNGIYMHYPFLRPFVITSLIREGRSFQTSGETSLTVLFYLP